MATLQDGTPALPSSPTLSGENPDLALDADLEKQLEGSVEQSSTHGGVASTDGVVKGGELVNGRLPHDDPLNPASWPTGKKIIVDIVLCVWVLSLTYASTAYVASLPALMKRFDVSQELAIAGVTFTVLGFAAGPLLCAPSSELYGRRAVYIVCGVFYIAFSWGAAFANNIGALLVFRFFIGFFGSASINNVPASVGDFTVPRTRGPFTVLYAVCAFGGPSIGPLLSAFIEHDAGFRWNLRVMAIFSTVTSILVAFVPETHHPTLHRWRLAKEAAVEVKPGGWQVIFGVYKQALARPFVFLFTEPVVLFVSVYLSVLYGVLYGFFEAFTVVWLEKRHFSITSYGLTYISLGLGFLVGAVGLILVSTRAYTKALTAAQARGQTAIPAEARLTLGYPGAIIVPLSLFLFAFTAPYPHVHWIVPCIAEFFFGLGVLLVFTAFIPYLTDVYQTHAASALAAGMASRALVGSVFPLFSLQLYHAATVQGATCLFAGIACLLAPIPFVFKRKGPELRRRSMFAA
ncbi:Major facilitator superfamily domain-containing protein [Rhodotorula toruloides]|uniref:Major facilitator superfamily domain-containing protein n=1 Tax=Rhodotorula toruloides TaxID=5286 RepID=A0A2S9ZX75_RHOTO|nr:Major facilitator superfamily domain-containing protein [Rhodotorula toruloides]